MLSFNLKNEDSFFRSMLSMTPISLFVNNNNRIYNLKKQTTIIPTIKIAYFSYLREELSLDVVTSVKKCNLVFDKFDIWYWNKKKLYC